VTAAETLQRHVALEFRVPCSAIGTKRVHAHDISLARHVWVYLLVQFLPRPERFPAKGGKTRRAGDQDGNIKPVARLLRLHPSGVRYAIRRVEDLRDDPQFDARIERLEALIAGA
jgi:hypothetical protein